MDAAMRCSVVGPMSSMLMDGAEEVIVGSATTGLGA